MVSLSSSCFLYFILRSLSASLMASTLNRSFSCISSLVRPGSSSLSPPTPGILSVVTQVNYRTKPAFKQIFKHTMNNTKKQDGILDVSGSTILMPNITKLESNIHFVI